MWIKTAIRPVMFYGTKYWAIKKQYVHKMSVADMRKLRWINGNTRFEMRKIDRDDPYWWKRWGRVAWDGLVMYKKKRLMHKWKRVS